MDTDYIVNKCFGVDKGSNLVKHLLDSFNDFLLRKLDDIIDGFNPIVIHHTFLPEEGVYMYTMNIEIKNPIITKPTIFEKDGSSKIMTPKDARNRNFTYASPIYVDMHITATIYNPDTKTTVEETKKIANVLLGKIPIMVRSKYCVLNDMPAATQGGQKDECPFDYGGYFIVNGNEKIIVSQDRISENKPYVFVNNKISTYSHIAEIRSVQENKFSVPKTTTLKLSNKPNQFGRYIRMNIHHVKQDLPLVVLFRALGVESDLDIAKHIIYDVNDPANAAILSELAGSFEEGNHITCQRDGIEYLAKYMNINTYPKDLCQNKAKRIEIVREILTNELLPHVGPEFYKKALYLGYMVNKLLKCYLGLLPYDDRDSYINKRIDIPGILLANLFRQYYGKLMKDMKNMINKEINNGAWKATKKFSNVINKVNINKIFKATIIESGLKYGLATGNWGLRSTKQGVAQVLNRLTYNATLSHERRIVTPVEKTGKLLAPRKLHSTQMGIICPAETPEGVSVGLVKNMSMVAAITIASNSSHVREMLDTQLGVILYKGDNLDIFEGVCTKVFVNGDLVGVHTEPHLFYQRIKDLKLSGTINIYTGIYWNIRRAEIWICTEGGRCVRPTVLIKDNKHPLADVDPAVLEKLSWMDLVIGSEAHGLPSAIEYIDVEESNMSMIAMTMDNVKKNRVKTDHIYPVGYTHMELDPSLMLGVLAGSIPFSDHNQAPRNCYQAAMGKQAIGIYTSNFLNRFDTMAHILNYAEKPIVQTKIAKIVNNDKLPCGQNVIVAIGTWTGYNQEDSLVMNQTAVDRGMFNSTYYRTYKKQNDKNHSTGEEEYFCKPNPATTKGMKPFNYDKLGDDGFVPKDTYVEAGDVIIGTCMPQKAGNASGCKDTSMALKNNEVGYIDRNCHDNQIVDVTTNGDGYQFAKVCVRSDRIPCVGDKFCVPETTDVLTIEGWKTIRDIHEGEMVLQLDPVTNMAAFVPVTHKYVFDHKGPLITISGPHVHLEATYEHKMWMVSPDPEAKGQAEFVLAKDVEPGMSFVKSCDGLDIDTDDVLVVLPQTEITELKDLAFLYGIFLLYGFTDPGHIYLVNAKAVKNVFKKYGVVTKRGSPGSKNSLRVALDAAPLLHAYCKANMNLLRIDTWIYHNKAHAGAFIRGVFDEGDTIACSTDRANLYQIVALSAGLSATVTVDRMSPRQATVTLVNKCLCDEFEMDIEMFVGKVFCIEVPSHVFYVRSRGKTMWTGNSSRHGQKGTVGILYRDCDMPFTKDGMTPDIIINPHAIPSRMTIAQLMECVMGKACSALGTTGDASPFTGMSVEDIAKVLEKEGLERYGNEIMYNSRTGEQMETAIFVGPTYYQRLKHMVCDKIHSRSSSGPVVLLTRQPAEGRARDGGLRLGEMEGDCCWAHGIASYLKERFMECSDNYRVHICKKCGMMANVNPENGIYMCKPCKNTTHFSELRIPYACKLLLQEIQSMSIGTRFITN